MANRRTTPKSNQSAPKSDANQSTDLRIVGLDRLFEEALPQIQVLKNEISELQDASAKSQGLVDRLNELSEQQSAVIEGFKQELESINGLDTRLQDRLDKWEPEPLTDPERGKMQATIDNLQRGIVPVRDRRVAGGIVLLSTGVVGAAAMCYANVFLSESYQAILLASVLLAWAIVVIGYFNHTRSLR